jgi:hypothetical protein
LRRAARSILKRDRNIARTETVWISVIERNLEMKTFIVYDLDSKMPVAVGEQVSAETARYCASEITGAFRADLFAEEIDLGKNHDVIPGSAGFF